MTHLRRLPRRPPLRRRTGRALARLALLLALLAGCATRPSAVSPRLPQEELAGLASWYGHPYHGRKTANGETYDMGGLTAAHRTLPFHSRVRVERMDNGRQIDVRINDRGPFVEGRVIDLSQEAARRLGMLEKGVAPVRLLPLRIPSDAEARWLVLVGGFRRQEDAEAFAAQAGARPRTARVLAGWHGDSRQFHVQIRNFYGEEDAWHAAARLRREGYSAFLVRSQ